MTRATELRPYQARALDELRGAYRQGARSIVLVMPTGAGKTRVGCELALSHLERGGAGVLWLAHRTELVQQAADRLRLEGVDRVGIIAASAGGDADPSALVQVASVQTLAARGLRPPASMMILDEAHHYVADQWGELASGYSDAVRLGLTATPERGDGRPLGDLFGALVVGATPRELTELGFLVPCTVDRPDDYDSSRLAGDPVDRYLEHAAGRRAFAFCALVSQAEDLAKAFDGRGIPARCVHADTPADERAATMAAFRRGDLMVLTNVYVLTEGVDVPEASCCILARGCGATGTYVQMVGRVLRPAAGKTDAVLLDLTGASHVHGLPADDRVYSLTGTRGISLAGGQDDGMQSGNSPNVPRITDEEIYTDASGSYDWGERREYYDAMARRALSRGFKLGFAAHKYRERFGAWPPWSWRHRWARRAA